MFDIHLCGSGIIQNDITRAALDPFLPALLRFPCAICILRELSPRQEGKHVLGGNDKVQELVGDAGDELGGVSRGVVGEDEGGEFFEQGAGEGGGECEVVGGVEGGVEVGCDAADVVGGGGDKVDCGDVCEGGAGGVELHVECDALLPEVLHPEAGREHVLARPVQYQHLPHKGGRGLQCPPGGGSVQVQQRQQCARLRLQQRRACHRGGGRGARGYLDADTWMKRDV